MTGTYQVTVGNRGRLVVPAEVREQFDMREGTQLVLLATNNGIALLTQEQLRDRVRRDLEGVDLVGDLVAERRAAAAGEDSA